LAEELKLDHARLRARISIDPADAIVAEFLSGYDDAFVLPNEKESHEGIRACLAQNFDPAYSRLAAQYGPFREFILVADDAAGNVVGGVNAICFPIGEAILSIHVNYAYVHAAFRRRGYLRDLIGLTADAARQLLDVKGAVATYLFMEQNNPRVLSEEDQETDARHAGLSQETRLLIWHRLGAKILDFAYEQPPLDAEKDADGGLILAVIGADGDAIDPILVREHLRKFFAISVLKGEDLASSKVASRQLNQLGDLSHLGASVPLLGGAGA